MPKTSAIERNKKRVTLSAKYAKRHAELKAILKNPATTDEEFFAAQKKLQKIPKNALRVRIRNRCSMTDARAATTAIWRLPHHVPRTSPRRQDPGVIKSSW